MGRYNYADGRIVGPGVDYKSPLGPFDTMGLLDLVERAFAAGREARHEHVLVKHPGFSIRAKRVNKRSLHEHKIKIAEMSMRVISAFAPSAVTGDWLRRVVAGGSSLVIEVLHELETHGAIEKSWRGRKHEGWLLTDAGRAAVAQLAASEIAMPERKLPRRGPTVAQRAGVVVRVLASTESGGMTYTDLRLAVGGRTQLFVDATRDAMARGLIERRFASVGGRSSGFQITPAGLDVARRLDTEVLS